MTQTNPTGAPKGEPDPQREAVHAVNAIDLALCHLDELIAMTRDLACGMHACVTPPETISHLSGRIGTLMHCAARELDEAKRAACMLTRPS